MIKFIKNNIPNSLKRRLKLGLRNILETPIYYAFKRECVPKKDIKRVVFVCKGNVCRSPFAEQLMRSLVTERGISVESCGLRVNQGAVPPCEAIDAALTFNVDIRDHIPKHISVIDLNSIDLLIPMEYCQYREVLVLVPDTKQNVHLLREFTPVPDSLLCNIADPYGQPIDEYIKCYSLIRSAVYSLYSKMFNDSSVIERLR